MKKVEEINEVINGILQLSFDRGREFEKNNLLTLLERHKQETHCDCEGCESWTQAFEFLMAEIKGEAK